MPKLSIITINRNNAAGLRKTIESVVSQTFTDFEYIIIDGASTDKSVDIIREYADKITYWVSEPDNGIYNAMNKGILKAKGEYLYFLNSGDKLYENNVLSFIFSKMPTSAILSGDILKLYADGTTVIDKGQLYAKTLQKKELSLYDMYLGNLNHQATFILKELFNEHGLYDEKYSIVSDWIFFLRTIGLQGVTAKYIDCVVSIYDMKGISSTNSQLLNSERSQALSQLIPKQILIDYQYFSEIDYLYSEIKKKHNYLFRFRIVFLITKYLNITLGKFLKK